MIYQNSVSSNLDATALTFSPCNATMLQDKLKENVAFIESPSLHSTEWQRYGEIFFPILLCSVHVRLVSILKEFGRAMVCIQDTHGETKRDGSASKAYQKGTIKVRSIPIDRSRPRKHDIVTISGE